MRVAIDQLAWHRVCAALLLFIALAIYTLLRLGGAVGPVDFPSAALSLWSMRLLFVIPLLFLIPSLQRWWIITLLLVPVVLAFVWQIASLELYAVQSRFFSFADLSDLWQHAETRPLIVEHLLSWKVGIFIVGFYSAYFFCAWGFKRLITEKWAALCVPTAVLIIGIGSYVASQIEQIDGAFPGSRLAVMPWSDLSYVNQGDPSARLAIAQQYWHASDHFFWQVGAADYVSALREKFKRRSIVLIVMESQGLTYVDGLGQGSANYTPSSPYLSQLAHEHIYFSNYFQSGYTTSSAAWSLLSSFPYFHEADFTPQLARLGVLKDFQTQGYVCEWLKAAPAVFANFYELAQNLDLQMGPTIVEKQQMKQRDSSLWTAWGMPDKQLYEIAYQRIVQHIKNKDGPFLECILSLSNHEPFRVPTQIDGVVLPADHSGGMRYADACLKIFIEQLQEIDIEKRPIIFITADTGFRGAPMLELGPDLLSVEPLESLRLPGVLILPQPINGLQQIDHVFSHEDVLPLLAEIVGIKTEFSQRLQTQHRVAVGINDYEGHSIVTADALLYVRQSLLQIKNYWQLQALPNTDPQFLKLEQCADYLHQLRYEIWRNAGVNALYRDQHREALNQDLPQ